MATCRVAKRVIFEEEFELGGPAEGKGCESEVFLLYVHRQNYFRDFCAAEGRRRILRIYSKLSIILEKNDGTKNVPLVPLVRVMADIM